jgi:hypothetical protein
MTTAATKPVKKTPHHYVDNKKFHAEMVEYRKKIDDARAHGLNPKHKDWPPVTNYIGECILKIATHLAYRANFHSYSYRDEMISDGIENSLMYAHNYDPSRKNPFAYFTQIIFFAFLRRIQKEKKEMAIKYAYIEQMDLDELFEHSKDDAEFMNNFIQYLKEHVDNIEASKRAAGKKKAAKKKAKKK